MLLGRRNVKDPRAIAQIMAEAEARLAAREHPDPYIREYIKCNRRYTCTDIVCSQMRCTREEPNGAFVTTYTLTLELMWNMCTI